MASFKKVNDKWQVSFYCKNFNGDNKKYKKGGFKTKKEANEYVVNYINLNKGTPETKFNDLFNEFLEHIYIEKKKRTIKQYSYIGDKIKKFFKGKKIKDLNNKIILDFYKSLIEYKTTYIVARKILNRFIEYINLYYNFNLKFQEIKIDIKTVKEERKKVIDEDTYNKLINSFNENNYEEYLDKVFFLMLHITGARCGEILALKKENINFTKNTIIINATKISLNETNLPKTKASNREIEIPKNYMEYLREVVRNLQVENEFLFYKSYETIRRTLRKKIKELGLNEIKMHDFRHTHASVLIKNGIDILSISKRLGHETPNITLSTYSHFFENEDKGLSNLLKDL